MGGPNGRGGSRNKKDNPALAGFREVCPPSKLKDLDKLYKQLNGDEAKIMEKIQEWWNDPQPAQEEEWENVTTSNVKKHKTQPAGRGGGRGRGPGRGRGREASGGRGGRSEGRGGRSEGRGGRGRSEGRGRGRGSENRDKQEPKQQEPDQVHEKENKAEPTPVPEPGMPAPAPVPGLKGAWGARAAAAAVTAPAPVAVAPPLAAPTTSQAPAPTTPQRKVEEASKPPENPLEIGIATQSDPTPSGLPPVDSKPIRTPVAAGGNVWATKGSAHLIQAEKPKPPPPAPAVPRTPIAHPPPPEALPMPTPPEPILDSGLSAGAWGKPPTSHSEQTPVEMPRSPAMVKHMAESIPTQAPAPVTPAKSAVPQRSAAPANVLNMGHWETGDTDDQNLDFGFGSFGADNDASDPAKVAASPANTKDVATAVSPARPPPGLSLGGMPPMPDGAVMVHELENKMESANLDVTKEKAAEKPITSALPGQSVAQVPGGPAPVLPVAGMNQQSFNQYGMAAGMYQSYGAAGNGFVNPAGPGFAGGVVPQQPGKPSGGLGQPGLYGNQPPAAPSSGNVAGVADSNNDSAPTAAPSAVPPGMPGTIPYANPALHYGQQHYYMGQPQGGIGYNYGYGQFGGVAQAGFGYQQVMGQNQGYGGPHYDDPSQQGNNHHGGSGGYQNKSGGGYRGRNNHHGNNQYQNQYNPQQHGGYGGQPYGMGYHGDHFNQRGGYPGGMGDPYNMQQGSGNFNSGGGFQEDDHKGKKGGRGQFHQGPPQHQLGGQQQQSFGLQGGHGNDSTPSTGAGGGWSGQAASGGGWSSGAPSWQGS